MHNESRHRKLSLWVAAFALCSALQVFRGAAGDSYIFVSGTILLILSTTLLEKLEFPSHRLASGRHLDWSGLVLLVALAFTPRHSAFDFGIFVLLLPIVVTLAWGERSRPRQPLTKRDRITRFAWSAWAIAMCLWEFAANILGQLSTDPNNFPTISVLVDPLLKPEIGQAGYVAVWLSVGYYLLKTGAK